MENSLKHKRKRKDSKLVEESPKIDANDHDASHVERAKHKKAKKQRKGKRSLNESAQLHEKDQEKGEEDIYNISSGAENHSTGMRTKRKQAKKKQRKGKEPVKKSARSQEKKQETEGDKIYDISSGDEDHSKGMRKWINEYHQSRPGLKVLQQRIDDFITGHESKLEQERKEREALAAEGGWTVVVHHKGRKKTTDSESGIAIGSVSQAAVENNLAKKKNKEVGLDFYRFQKREAQRNEIMALQSKFEEDKKRIQQLRAARKFKPY